MAKGRQRIESIWDRCAADLAKRRSNFRMHKREKSAVIRIKEVRGGKIVRWFSSQGYHWRNERGLTTAKEEKEIESCCKLCIKAHESGS